MRMMCDECGAEFMDGDECYVFNLSGKEEITLCPNCVEYARTTAYSDETELYNEYIDHEIDLAIEREHGYDF